MIHRISKISLLSPALHTRFKIFNHIHHFFPKIFFCAFFRLFQYGFQNPSCFLIHTWRRLIVIPFHAKIQGNTDIKNYAQYLVDHAGGAVLSWLMEGARKVIAANYQINRPQCVLDAIGAYREGNDWLGNFIHECCEVDKSYQEKSGVLYQKYREFCNENGEYVRSTSDFYAALEQAGFKKQKLRSGQMVIGLQIRFDFLD